WPRDGGPRYAGVSSFGFGGPNAHAVLGEAPARAPAPAEPEAERLHVLPLSAGAPDSLRALATRYRDFLGTGAPPVRDVCYTAAVRRTHQEHRLAVVGRTADDFHARLDAYLAGRT